MKFFKSKILFIIGFISLFSVNSFAGQILVDPGTGKIEGVIDLVPYLTGAAIVIGAMAAFFSVKKAVSLFH